ncbi:MAG: molybdate ABC transporter substrate-binding protein [Woeseiaceae bacterium]
MNCVTKVIGQLILCGLTLLGSIGVAASSERVVVAAASNFVATAEILARLYEQDTGQAVVVVAGSSGKHFAQMMNGAPFDILLSADQQKPAELFARGLLGEAPKTYAIGRLVAWSATQCRADSDLALAIDELSGQTIAIANPAVAPYGVAAKEVLTALLDTDTLLSQMVFGENISQVFQFAISGNVDFAFLARSQWIRNRVLHARGCHWLVPKQWHRPVIQQAGLSARAVSNPSARSFYRFLFSDAARKIIEDSGFETIDTPSPTKGSHP